MDTNPAPVARRTRGRRDEQLMIDYRRWKDSTRGESGGGGKCSSFDSANHVVLEPSDANSGPKLGSKLGSLDSNVKKTQRDERGTKRSSDYRVDARIGSKKKQRFKERVESDDNVGSDDDIEVIVVKDVMNSSKEKEQSFRSRIHKEVLDIDEPSLDPKRIGKKKVIKGRDKMRKSRFVSDDNKDKRVNLKNINRVKKKAKAGDGSDEMWLADDEGQERVHVSGSTKKRFFNSKIKDKRNKKNVRGASVNYDASDDDDDDVQIIDVAVSSPMVGSNSLSSGKEPCTRDQYKAHEHKAPEDFISSSEVRGNSACGVVSNQGQPQPGAAMIEEEEVDFIRVSDGSAESSECEDFSFSDPIESSSNSSEHSDSSDSLYVEKAGSSSEEEEEPSDEEESEVRNSVVKSHDSSSSLKTKKVGENGNEFNCAKRTVEDGKCYKPSTIVDGEKIESKVGFGAGSVAARVRQRRDSRSSKIKKKKDKPRDPMIALTDDELSYISLDDEAGGDKTEGRKKEAEKVIKDGRKKEAEKFNEEGRNLKRKVGRPPKNKCNAEGSPAPISVNQILVDSILGDGVGHLEKFAVPEDNSSEGEAILPLKFRFGDEEVEPPKKDFWDIEDEKLFNDMDFAMAAGNIGSSDSYVVGNEDSNLSKTENDPATGCLQGNHHFVIDEQIGLICTICSFVKQEIKSILPSFGKHPCGRTDVRAFDMEDYFSVAELPLEDFNITQHAAFKHRLQAEGTVWDLIPGIRDSMYPHQQEGFEFIWNNIAGSIFIEKAKQCISDGGGSGCIISHAPGTGKTRLTIMFLLAYMQLNPESLPLIIAPCSMLLTWEGEFRKWNVKIPFHSLNNLEYSGQESTAAKNLLKIFGRQGQDSALAKKKGQDAETTRLVKLFSWKKEQSVLGISYQLFEELAGINALISRGKKNGKAKHNATGEQIREMLLMLPGLLVLDEGHTPRNSGSEILKALLKVKTERRIILSGTPFQNNFDELCNTLCLARPKFADQLGSQPLGNFTKKHGRKKIEIRGKWASCTNSIGNDEKKLEELKAMISDFVHVYQGTILREELPGLSDRVVVLSPAYLQKDFMEILSRDKISFKQEHLLALAAVHPALLLSRAINESEELLVHRDKHRDKLRQLRLNPDAGVKTKFLKALIELSEKLNERVLVFSQLLRPLKLIMEHLKNHFHWTEGKEILYMDGKNGEKQRHAIINMFNDPASKAQVLLASTKASCEGINLVGASRVVFLDVLWNPSVKRQAISRAYRLGQKKVVYVYHLIACRRELEKYKQQAGKERISDLVFSLGDGIHKLDCSASAMEDKILQELHEGLNDIFEDTNSLPEESDLIRTFG